ncbi:MAG: hypothetical protein GSR84_05190 [Desulfurococcales archaeon]|nr:hypothetical protein [Desulfurococcales archaeon]
MNDNTEKNKYIGYIRDSIHETIFMLKMNIYTIVFFSIFAIIYMPLAINNIFEADYYANTPNYIKLGIIIPIIITYNILFSLLISIIVASAIEQERAQHILEYLYVYSRYNINGFLAIKLLSSLLMGITITIPYILLVYTVINMHINIRINEVITIFLSILISVVSFTYIMLIIVLVLRPKYTSTVKFSLIILVYLAISLLARKIESPESLAKLNVTLTEIVLPTYIVSAVILIISIIVYHIMKDRIVELSLREG